MRKKKGAPIVEQEPATTAKRVFIFKKGLNEVVSEIESEVENGSENFSSE